MLNGCLMLPQVYTTMVTSNSERFRCYLGTVMNSQSNGLLVHFTVLACLLTGTVCGCVSEDAWPLIVCNKNHLDQTSCRSCTSSHFCSFYDPILRCIPAVIHWSFIAATKTWTYHLPPESCTENAWNCDRPPAPCFEGRVAS